MLISTDDIPVLYGHAETVSPRVKRVLARNPGLLTYTGTATFIVGPPSGRGDVVVIDPGPLDDAHQQALVGALDGAPLSQILVTHHHLDHAALARVLAEATGATVRRARLGRVGLQAAEMDFGQTASLKDGDVICGQGWTLRTIATPGHTSDHLAFFLEEERALFSGDHVMGWSTTVVSPPDGDMLAYLDSLRKVIDLDPAIIWPTHGPPITEPRPFLKAYLDHRLKREAQVITRLAAGDRRISEMTPVLYSAVDRRLWPAASLSIWAHLIALEKQGRVRAEPEPEIDADWILV